MAAEMLSLVPDGSNDLRTTTLLTSLLTLVLTTISVVSLAGEQASGMAVIAIGALTVLGSVSGWLPEVAGSGMLLVVGAAGVIEHPFLSLTGFSPLLPLAVLGFRGSMRKAVLLGVADLALLTVPVSTEATMAESLANGLLWATLIVLAIVVGMTGNQVRRRARAMQEGFERAQSDERRAIAAELHDSVARMAAGIAVRAESTRLTYDDDPALASTMSDIGDQCRELTRDLRGILEVLRAPEPRLTGAEADRTGGAPASVIVFPEREDAPAPSQLLDGEVTLLRSAGFAVEVFGAVPDGLGARTTALLRRVIAEGCTNARRHGDVAQPVRILLGRERGACELVIINGIPEEPRSPGSAHLGISSMKRQAEAAGASLMSRAAVGAWVLHLSVAASSEPDAPVARKEA
ncbi:histidine kinase [Actinomyces radicidentis]|uniref:sensor histidine kinase n=1 Tax=Actinomyces radicidentis TaxID=111015 RepID=UPI0028EBB98A|nr:histidine kinase [Actinomyces radicidentis]